MDSDFPVSNAGINLAFEFINDAIAQEDLAEATAHRLCVILDEVCSNMIRHDDALSEDDSFSCTLTVSPVVTTLVISDEGTAFDPLGYRPEQAPDIGGHGISLIKGLSSSVTYERERGQNILTIEIATAE